MSKGPETNFYTGVHKHLPPVDRFYRVKMHNPYAGGIADHWYSSRLDLWVEWKFVELPARPDTIIDLTAGKKPALSVLQQDWIAERRAEGRNVWVGVGSAKGGVLWKNDEWLRGHRTDDFTASLRAKPELAQTIFAFCQGH